MELRHLRHFVVVAEELHFARAAKRLGMEQSPLSQSIKNLEYDVGVELFKRTTRRTWLTPAGTRFYRDAKRILRDVDALKASALQGRDRDFSSIRLIIEEDIVSEPFTRVLFELKHDDRIADLDVREMPHADAVRLLRDGGADLAFTLNPRTEPDLERIRGWSERITVALPIGHPFSDREKISLRDLGDQTIALPSDTERPGYLTQIEDVLSRHQVRPARRRDVRNWTTAVSFAATGHAIALCPATLIQMSTAVVTMPLEEEDAQLVTWVLYRHAEPSPTVSLVLAIVAEVASEPFLSVLTEPDT